MNKQQLISIILQSNTISDQQEDKRIESLEEKSKGEMIEIMEELFNNHVKDQYSNKRFNTLMVVDTSDVYCNDWNNKTKRGAYNYQKVYISYLSRVTWHKKDYDRFTDYTITVDGKLIKVVEKE